MNNLEKAKQALQTNNGQTAGQVIPPVVGQTPVNPHGSYGSNQQWQPSPIQKVILDFGKTIKSERAARGWSQRELARLSGYSQGTITRAENNMWVSLRCLFCIAEALGKKITLT